MAAGLIVTVNAQWTQDMMIKTRAVLTASIITAFSFASNASERIMAGHFSAMPLNSLMPKGWQPLTFDNVENKTAYFIVSDNDTSVVKAVSNASASGMIHKISINPDQYPILEWRWKVSNIIDKANIYSKEGDDYPARIYVTFEYDVNKLTGWQSFKAELYKSIYGEYPPLAVLNYVWDNKHPVDTLVDNAYTDRVKMIVVRSGKDKLGKWITQQRNVYEDYQRAFGEVPASITGIAIMTDSDNTMESAMAYYGDISFNKPNK